jgi:hypothetical protein
MYIDQEGRSIMNFRTNNRVATWSVLSIMLTATASAVHHVYRDGLGQLALWVLIIVLPYTLMRWFTHSGKQWLVWTYVLYNVVVITQFGIVDGFLDHTLKALGFPHLTFLPGGEAEVVKTVFSLWSPQAGNLFYEGTGVLTFIGSVFATVSLYRWIRTQRRHRGTRATEQLRAPGEISA